MTRRKPARVPLLIEVEVHDRMALTCSDLDCRFHHDGICDAFTKWSRSEASRLESARPRRSNESFNLYKRHELCLKAEVAARALVANDRRKRGGRGA